MTSPCYVLLTQLFSQGMRSRKEFFHLTTLSYPRDIRPLVILAVQLPHYVLSFGSERRSYQTETHHIFSKTERLSWKRTISWPTQGQQKPQLWLREICLARGHQTKRVRQRQHSIYQSLRGKWWNEWTLIFFQRRNGTFLRQSITWAQGLLGLFV